MNTEDILSEREKTHGDFEEVAFTHDGMMDFIQRSSNVLSCAQFLAISNICLKIARIACGDPNFEDHWDDIAGYAQLGKGARKAATNSKTYPCRNCGEFKPEQEMEIMDENICYFFCTDCARETRERHQKVEIISSKMEHML